MSGSQTDIHRRDDADPKDGEREYGKTEFADPVNKKYPIDGPEHIRAAWGHINQEVNAAKYSKDEVELIKTRIRQAAGRLGVQIDSE